MMLTTTLYYTIAEAIKNLNVKLLYDDGNC
jgi:hypothetical protein